jgi:hypothetical protein
MRFSGFPEALSVIFAQSLPIDSIGKELENRSFQGRKFREHHDITEAQERTLRNQHPFLLRPTGKRVALGSPSPEGRAFRRLARTPWSSPAPPSSHSGTARGRRAHPRLSRRYPSPHPVNQFSWSCFSSQMVLAGTPRSQKRDWATHSTFVRSVFLFPGGCSFDETACSLISRGECFRRVADKLDSAALLSKVAVRAAGGLNCPWGTTSASAGIGE